MRKVVIVTHKSMAIGCKDTLVFFTNFSDQIVAISAYDDGGNVFPEEKLKKALEQEKNPEDEIIILTDLLGGSVNQHTLRYIKDDVFLITGFNLALAVSILLEPDERLTIEKLSTLIGQSQDQMVLMNTYKAKNDSVLDE